MYERIPFFLYSESFETYNCKKQEKNQNKATFVFSRDIALNH